MAAYYNEFDPFAAAWLRELIKENLIAPGDVDERSIKEVKPEDLRGYTQCHFFAGIGIWSHALRMSGWSDAERVWTGSCPCQPFAVGGNQLAQDDDRHLWPEMRRLIAAGKPSVFFGEQVASAITYGWLDEVANDMEGAGYEFAASILPACSVGAPHRRDRLWFVASNDLGKRGSREGQESLSRKRWFSWCKDVGGVSDLRNRPDLPEPLIRRYGNGHTAGVAQLHAIGNSIVPQVAATFIQAYLECRA